MELSFASAFSTGGLVGHFAYVLLILSMMMRQMVWLRIFVIASALVGIAYSIIWLRDPVSSFWETLLVTVNVVQLLITWRQNTRARFTLIERAFADRRLRGLPTGEQRRILDLGEWSHLPAGTVLATQGERPDKLTYIAEGWADILIADQIIAECGPGTYVGEMSIIGDRPASATARLREESLVWRLPTERLSELDEKQPTWLAVIEAGIARDMRGKLVAANDSLRA